MEHLVVDTFVPQRGLAGFELEFEAVTIVDVDCWVGLLAAPVLEQVAGLVAEFAAVAAGWVVTGSVSVVLVVGVVVVVVAAAFVLAESSAPYCPLTLQLEPQERICFESE